RAIYVGEGIGRRRDRDEFVVYVGRILPARRTSLSCSGIQPCRRAISGRLAFSRNDSASDSVRRVRARFVRRKRLNHNPERGTLIFAFALIPSRSLVFTHLSSRVF